MHPHVNTKNYFTTTYHFIVKILSIRMESSTLTRAARNVLILLNCNMLRKNYVWKRNSNFSFVRHEHGAEFLWWVFRAQRQLKSRTQWDVITMNFSAWLEIFFRDAKYSDVLAGDLDFQQIIRALQGFYGHACNPTLIGSDKLWE